MANLQPRIDLRPRTRVCMSPIAFAGHVCALVWTWPFVAALLAQEAAQRVRRLWGRAFSELWLVRRACADLGALERFLAAHGGRTLSRAGSQRWEWQDDGTRFTLWWLPPAERGAPGELDLTAALPFEAMRLALRDHEGPLLQADPADQERLEAWARERGERIVQYLYDATGALPELSVELRTARVRVRMVGPLKPLVGALELLVTGVPEARRPV